MFKAEMVNQYSLLCLQDPPGMVGHPTLGYDLTYMLPPVASSRGLKLLDVIYEQPEEARKDPLIIFDRRGRILHIWPDDYTPGSAEIIATAKKLVGAI
jgi:hypothetical protein